MIIDDDDQGFDGRGGYLAGFQYFWIEYTYTYVYMKREREIA